MSFLKGRVMAFKKYLRILASTLIISGSLIAVDNLTSNDPYPLYSTVYPYSFLTTRHKAQLMRYDYTYPVDKFRISFSAFRQSACRARDSEGAVVHIGDLPNGRWNMLGLFYDEPMRNLLFQALGINTVFACSSGLENPVFPTNAVPCQPFCPTNTCNPTISATGCVCEELRIPADKVCGCFNVIASPRKSDPNQEFGFFSIPIDYVKWGMRVESEVLIFDRCFYAIGLQLQFGIVDVRQTVRAFNDLTYQALGLSAPVFDTTQVIPPTEQACAFPQPVVPTPIVPPFTDPTAPATVTNQNIVCPNICCQNECAIEFQPFRPCCNATCCFSFSCDCKKLVIEKIMKQKDIIADILDLDLCNYHKIGIEDLRLNAFYRHIYVINEDSDIYPRLLFMPFATAGVGIPMMKAQPTYKPFAVPLGNNNHALVSFTGGFTLDFLDTIDLTFSAGYTHFFKHDFCNFRLPTNVYESGIFPYKADVSIKPGATWHLSLGMNAYRFIDNLSVWAEFVYVSHAQDKIKVCKSFIPSTSCYFKQGFLTERAECLSKWEVMLFNIGFNYDLSDHLAIGFLWQAPVRQRNAYRSGTLMGSLTFVY